MVDDLRRQQIAAQRRLHHEAMLKDVATRKAFARSPLRMRMIGNPHQNIAILVDVPAPLPVRMTGPRARATRRNSDPVLATQLRHLLVARSDLLCHPSVSLALGLNPRADLINRPNTPTIRMFHGSLLRW